MKQEAFLQLYSVVWWNGWSGTTKPQSSFQCGVYSQNHMPTNTDHSGRAAWGMNYVRSLERWNREFDSHSRHRCLYYVRLSCLCCSFLGRGLAIGWSPVQGVLPTACRVKKSKNRPRPNKWLYNNNNVTCLLGSALIIRAFWIWQFDLFDVTSCNYN
jgi:hypothetical protein